MSTDICPLCGSPFYAHETTLDGFLACPMSEFCYGKELDEDGYPVGYTEDCME